MRYLSVCSGIEAAAVAWGALGWAPVAFAEIEPFPSAVLEHHYPHVPNLGDMRSISDVGAIDLLVGGTPCQSFSVAGLRAGMADPRGGLALVYLLLARRLRPRWILWENVQGVLSSKGGRDFGAFLGGLAELGYGFAYRVLDAQFFGLAQRRKRVFVVGRLGDWRGPAAVLLERSGLRWDPPPSRGSREGVAGTLAARTSGGGGLGTDFDCDGGLTFGIRSDAQRDGKAKTPSADAEGRVRLRDPGFGVYADLAPTLDASSPHAVAHALRGEGFDASEDGTGRGIPLVSFGLNAHHPRLDGESETLVVDPNVHGDIAEAIGAKDTGHAIAFQEAQTGCREYELAGALRAHGPGHDPVGTRLRTSHGVRRLTPRECERLQGFPDDYTLVPYRGRPAKDGPRYRALGNSMAVPVMRWIGQRIAAHAQPASGAETEGT